VLRASGSDGYNDYFYSELGVGINSVESIVFNDADAAFEPYVWQKIEQAEAIWFAGGDQWDYVSYWRDTPVDSLINLAIQERNIVIGGTSAGMAIQGGYYFSAQNGTVTSSTALSNPYDEAVTVDATPFLQNVVLADVITDTHFDNPDRRGRLTTFLARMFVDYGLQGKAIACDEYTAVCIDETGIAHVFGDYPSYDDNAYFVQVNCGLPDVTPELCADGEPLTWNLGGEALKAYRIKGTTSGDNYFDLTTWETGSGGEWLHWSANNGDFLETTGSEIDCSSTSTVDIFYHDLRWFPNPTSGVLHLNGIDLMGVQADVMISDMLGQLVADDMNVVLEDNWQIDLSFLPEGLYLISMHIMENSIYHFPIQIVK
jgi:cyanophycinase-like exopeptidase